MHIGIELHVLQEVHDFEHVEVPDLSLLEDELAEYVAKLAQEAAEYAINYRPSQEELFEAAAACSMMEKVIPGLMDQRLTLRLQHCETVCNVTCVHHVFPADSLLSLKAVLVLVLNV